MEDHFQQLQLCKRAELVKLFNNYFESTINALLHKARTVYNKETAKSYTKLISPHFTDIENHLLHDYGKLSIKETDNVNSKLEDEMIAQDKVFSKTRNNLIAEIQAITPIKRFGIF